MYRGTLENKTPYEAYMLGWCWCWKRKSILYSYKEVIKTSALSTRNCKYSLDSPLVQSPRSSHLIVLFRSLGSAGAATPPPHTHPLPGPACPPVHSLPGLVWPPSSFSLKHIAGFRWPLQKTTSSGWGNEWLFILRYEKSGALEHEDDLRF